jgi:hypothetical protein
LGLVSRVTPTSDLSTDPFAALSLEQFAAIETDRAEPFLDRLERARSVNHALRLASHRPR